MKNLKIVLIGLLVFISSMSFAQVNIAATVGAAAPILNNGLGIQIGINPSQEVTDYISIEGQVSYIHINASGFLTGEDVEMRSLNALAGGRLYFRNSEKSFRPYFNLLAGVNYYEEYDEMGLGLSLGIYAEVNDKFLVGIGAETQSFFVAKAGYQF